VKVVIHENTAGIVHLVLPCRADVEDPLHNFGDALGRIIRRTWEDAFFRARLVEDPGGAITEVTGLALPPSTRLVIHCNTSDVEHFVLPINPGTDELSERNRYLIGGSMLPPRPGR
jgi:Nitrile hydratase, alpha chain